MTSSAFLQWLGATSLAAGVLVLLVLLIRCLTGRLLSPAWHYALWLLVLARLLVPVAPSTPLSIENLWRSAPTTSAKSSRFFVGQLPATATPHSPPNETAAPAANAPSLSQILLLGWALGALAIAALLLRNAYRLHHVVRDSTPITEPHALDLLTDCARRAGIRHAPPLRQSDSLSTPVLAGLSSPAILLPGDTLATATPDDLRHIFLHELVHLRRRDLPVAAAASALLAFHWFNPLLWLALARLRSDRELACDATVLRLLGHQHAPAYSRTILKLAEASGPARAPLFTVGITESKSKIERRIMMICSTKNQSKYQLLTGAVMTAVLVAAGFTRAESSGPAPAPAAAQEPLPANPGLLNGAKPFKLTVHDQTGEIKYHFSPTREVESVHATSDVTFTTSDTTIRCETFEFTSATQTITAQGPGLEVELNQGQIPLKITADKLFYGLEKSYLEFEGNPQVIQTSKDGNITRTSGDKIVVTLHDGKYQLRVKKE